MNLCAVKIENITDVLHRKSIYILPTSMKVSEGMRKQGQKELTAASCNEGLSKCGSNHKHANPVYNPKTFPLGSLTVQRAPQPHRPV
jgi:hypothetical protein